MIVASQNSASGPRSARITREDILKKTNQTALWEYYTESLRGGKPLRPNLKISNPFLTEKQRTPSFTFWRNPFGQWNYQDYATGDHGDIFSLVAKKHGLTFPQTLERIAEDFHLVPDGEVPATNPTGQRLSRPAVLQDTVPAETTKTETASPQPQPAEKPFTLVSRPFTSAELAFWAAYGIKPEVLEAHGVQAVQEATGTSGSGKPFRICSTPESPVFAYQGDGWAKLYRPVEKEFRFAFLGQRPRGFVFGKEQLPEKGEFVLLTGGEKDVLSLAAWSIPAICLNSETANLDEDLLQELRSRFEHIVVLYDTDETGMAQSERLCKKHGLSRIVLPGIPGGGKDISDYMKAKCDVMAFLDMIGEAFEGSCRLPVVGCRELTQDGCLNQDLQDFGINRISPQHPENHGLDNTQAQATNNQQPITNNSPSSPTGNRQPATDNFPKNFTDMAEEGRHLPDLRRVFGNYILEGSTVLFPSERGVGKTYFMLQLALSVAAGAAEFCGEPLDLVGNTLYINFELGERVLKRRLAKLYETRPMRPDNPYGAYSLTYQNSLTERMPEIEQHLLTVKPILVILDNLRAAFSDRDNERNQEMTRTLMELNALRERHKFALVLVHHTKKGHGFRRTDSDMQSGAGALTDLADADFFLRNSRQDANLRILRRVKSRECEAQDRAKLLRLNTETLWFEMVDDGVNEEEHIYMDKRGDANADKKAQALELFSNGHSIRQIATQLDLGKSTVDRWVKEIK